MIYCGENISPNISETHEGYLIAMNVPIARTGEQKYLPREVTLSDPDEDIEDYIGSDGMVSVCREPEEVFSPTTIASFEGKPITEGHPHTGSQTGMLDAANESLYSKGHMQNVHKGIGEYANDLVADLFITDPVMVDTVKSKKKREVSCGYTSEFVAEHGKVYQRNIRGNHVAIVPRGRAGSGVAIHDNLPSQAGRRTHMTLNEKLKEILGLGAKQYIADAEPGEVAELLGGTPKPAAPAGDGIPPAVPAQPAAPAASPTDQKLDKLIALIEKALTPAAPAAPAAPKNPLAALDEDIAAKEKVDDEEEHDDNDDDKSKSKTIKEEPAEDCNSTGDSAIEHVKRMKTIIAKMPEGAVRDEAVNELRTYLKGSSENNSSVYGEIATSVKNRHVHDSQPGKQKTISERAQEFAEKAKAMREGGNN